jgi:hypothetical protein
MTQLPQPAWSLSRVKKLQMLQLWLATVDTLA